MSVNIISICILSVAFYKNGYIKKVSLKDLSVSVVPIIAILVIIFQLSALHFNYSGEVRTTDGVKVEENMRYLYPYFSDEWITASVSDYSIQNHSLPLVNPLDEGKEFPNLLVFFHSFISEIFLILNINPVIGFAFVSILSGVSICLIFYILLRSLKISIFASSISMLSVPYITNGANLPGIWFLMPFIISCVVFLLSLSLYFLSEKRMALLSSVFSFILYPPIIVFIFPILIFGKILFSLKKKVYITIVLAAVSIFLIGLVAISLKSLGVFELAASYIFRSNLVHGIPSYNIFNVLPLFSIPFIILGLVSIYKKKIYLILIPVVVGIIFWIVYTSTTTVFIIEYSRIVVLTSIFLMITSGFGYEWLILKYKVLQSVVFKIVVISIFIFLSFLYPIYNSWDRLVLQTNDGEIIYPAQPINKYLIQDDLDLFDGITKSKFISPEWKGLVIGVATKNFPLYSKSSTMEVKSLSYYNFLGSNCKSREDYIKQFDIEYVYILKTDCPNYIEIGTSKEGLYLYQVGS